MSDALSMTSASVLTDTSNPEALLSALKSRVHQLSILKEIGEALYGTIDLDQVLHLILVGVTAGPGLRFNRAFLLLMDDAETVLEGRLAIGPSDADEANRIWQELAATPMTLRQMLSKYEGSLAETNEGLNRIVRELRVPFDDATSLLAQAIRVGTAVTLPKGDLSPFDQQLADRLGTRSFAIAPLQARGRTIGALLADNAITGREIQGDDLEMLQLLATTSATAIDNSRLYAELERRLTLLERARAEARRSQQAVLRAERLSVIGEMAARVAHDIRNPLVAIGGFARSLMTRAAPDDPSRSALSVIVEEVTRLENIVTKVLDQARPSTSHAQTVQLNRLIEESIKLVSAELEAGHVRILLELDPGLPLLSADSDRIVEMVLNLVRNAKEAMPDGGTLTIVSLPKGDLVEMHVIDTGCGVPHEIRDRIFSPFFTTKRSGSGLGLTIVEQIAGEHGGSVIVRSTPGAGSTFIVRLPFRRDEADHGQAAGGRG